MNQQQLDSEELDGSEQTHDWLQEEPELPPRPRHRLLGKGANPIAIVLLGVLLCACGFIGGVLVQKGQESESSTPVGNASGFASRPAALRGRGSGAAGLLGASAEGERPTAGTVAYLQGSSLYVTNAEGNTVKVTTSAATSVNKTVKTTVSEVHPGETVTIVGAAGSNGAISAESISVGGGGALAALFGGARGTGSSSAGNASGGKEPALFGNGG